jgi:hypothetical protein
MFFVQIFLYSVFDLNLDLKQKFCEIFYNYFIHIAFVIHTTFLKYVQAHFHGQKRKIQNDRKTDRHIERKIDRTTDRKTYAKTER